MAKRPFLSYRIDQLQDVFEQAKGDAKALKRLQDELRHRTTPKAFALKARVDKVLAAAANTDDIAAGSKNSAAVTSSVAGAGEKSEKPAIPTRPSQQSQRPLPFEAGVRSEAPEANPQNRLDPKANTATAPAATGDATSTRKVPSEGLRPAQGAGAQSSMQEQTSSQQDWKRSPESATAQSTSPSRTPRDTKENVKKPMDIAHTRISALIEFAKESAKLRANPPRNVAQHKQFYQYEDKFHDLPGLKLDLREDDSDEVWLRLERMHQSRPPEPESELLALWIELNNSPFKEPGLKGFVSREELINIGALPEHEKAGSEGGKEQAETVVALEEFEGRESVALQLETYICSAWKAWAEHEKKVRKSIELYGKLFLLHQQLQGDLVDAQLELVWGVGIAVVKRPDGPISYPILTQLVEISLDEKTMALEIRPRSTEGRLEADIFAAEDNPGVAKLSAAAKEFFSGGDAGIVPFDRATFEDLLLKAVSLLSNSGSYWPHQTNQQDRLVPKATDNLVVTDTWVLFARPRSASIFVQDLERFEKALGEKAGLPLPAAVAALVTEPSASSDDPVLPPFRGTSMVAGHGCEGSGRKAQELYFPKPFNEEQVQIVQMLEAFEGVTVQGPPGTGKTHTIANVICHYLALGKRVLVTSMKDPALTVLQEKLPEDIRPLAISLLTSEAEGMKQFEFAIDKIASEVASIDKREYRQEIERLSGQIDALHVRIARTDREISDWAHKNMSEFSVDGEKLQPLDAAIEIATRRDEVAWFPDELTIGEEHRPQFDTSDVLGLREARQALGEDIGYLGLTVPPLNAFPETAKLLEVHQNLTSLHQMKAEASESNIPALSDSSQETIKVAITAQSTVSNLRVGMQAIENARQAWLPRLEAFLRENSSTEVVGIFRTLRGEILEVLDAKKSYLERPVALPDGFESQEELATAVTNLSQGKSPFGIAGMFGKGAQKQALDAVRIVDQKPQSKEDWEHALSYLQLLQKARGLLVRWNALADELHLPRFEPMPSRISAAGHVIDLFDKLEATIRIEEQLGGVLKGLLPTWDGLKTRPLTIAALDEAERIIAHHLRKQRLGETWAVKENFLQALARGEGPITQRLQNFLQHMLGRSDVTDAALQTEWSSLMAELRRVHELKATLKIVSDVTDKIRASGAIRWAKRLRSEAMTSTQDELLPDNWKETWRLVRMVNFVSSIDAREELQRLSRQRNELEGDLAKRYQDSVSRRTWLKLAEKATGGVRSALEAYRTAIRRIGKGTGVRASRFRQDARFAAKEANAAIPCWIMPHYRICESLPPEFGAFDLVIIDEASQSDLSALPAILRAEKVLVVGDDKQVSPDGVGLAEDKVRNLMGRFLRDQVPIYRPQMSPDRSIYDLFKVVFARSSVMLKEHFRCVGPIIEYSKREFYNHELKPLRLPTPSERLDPPLVDVLVKDGFKDGHVNRPEAQYIVHEIGNIVRDPANAKRTIGVVSLIGNEQALLIMQMLNDELGEETVTRFHITCGDARTFQGKERDIMFLSMVASPGQAHAQTTDSTAQRFNVAASRARDRMYLVRSIELNELSGADKYRVGLIQHFESPFAQDPEAVAELRTLCESDFEREVFDLLVERGYRVTPQVRVGAFRIDLVVEGEGDARLAVECDGDQYHGPDAWDSDMRRQRILERAGWTFWRCFASTFVMQRVAVVQDLFTTLESYGIHPVRGDASVQSAHVSSRKVCAMDLGRAESANDAEEKVSEPDEAAA